MSGILFDRARSSPDPSWRTIGELVGDAAERFTDREFLRFPGESLSFAGAHAASNRLAHVLIAHGVRPGDRVAIMMGNVPDWPLSWFAIGKAGAVEQYAAHAGILITVPCPVIRPHCCWATRRQSRGRHRWRSDSQRSARVHQPGYRPVATTHYTE